MMKTNLSTLLETQDYRFNGAVVNGINARNLHQALDVKRDYSNWIKGRIKTCNFIEGQDFIFNDVNLPKSNSIKNKQFTPKLAKTISSQDPEFSGTHKPKTGRPEAYIIVTIDMAKHLCLMERNEIGYAIRQHFIEAEKALRETAPSIYKNTLAKTKARLASIDYNNEMTNSIKAYYARQNKPLERHHFINEQNLIDTLELGQNVQQWKAERGIKGKVRDFFTTTQLETLKQLQVTNTALLALDMSYQERKAQLTKLADRLIGGE